MQIDLKQLNAIALKASSWTFIGHMCSQSIRFLSHLLLVRLLRPEDFGLIQLIYVFVYGLSMFSDFGINVNIIQHHRGAEVPFLQTAWTIQVIRGMGIWIGCAVLAWPLSLLYAAPAALWLFPLVGIGYAIESFSSTYLSVLRRNMELKKLTIVDISSNLAGVLGMLIMAWYWRQAWTLITGSLISAALKTLLSYWAFNGPRMAFQWESRAVHDILHFGKWVFISSMTTFFSARLDFMIMGLYLTQTQLGYYGIASSFIQMVVDLVATLTSSVLLPMYAHLKQQSLEIMRKKILQMRSALTILMLPPLYFFIFEGQRMVDVLYPADYHDIGWMLQILAVGGVVKVLASSISPVLIGLGDSFSLALVNFIQFALLIIFMLIGAHFYGTPGLIWATVLTGIFSFPALIYFIKPYRVWTYALDVGCFTLTAMLLMIYLLF